jgi:RHS repeat-associated protein
MIEMVMLLTVSDVNGTIKREYDALNRVTKYTDIQGNTIQYAYDEVGNLVKLTYPNGKKVHYRYDAANQLIKVTDWAGRKTGYEWDANGRLVKEMRPNGTQLTRRYDKAGQLVQQQDVSPSGEVIAQFDFTYDAVGNITNETPALKPPVVDATLTYTAANRLATYNGEAVEFDADGNMTTGPLFDEMTAFRFDSRNRLIGVADTVYRYDAENQRVAVSVAGATSSYVINPQAALSQVLVRTAPSGTTYYVYGLGLIGEETNSNYQAYHYDLRGSTVALTNSAGTVVERFAYSAFAQLVSHPDALPATPFLYNGRDGVMTDASGLYYMRARYYSPEIRRFVNQDVLLGDVGDGQSLNRYAYVTGRPVSFIDPFGLQGYSDTYNENWQYAENSLVDYIAEACYGPNSSWWSCSKATAVAGVTSVGRACSDFAVKPAASCADNPGVNMDCAATVGNVAGVGSATIKAGQAAIRTGQAAYVYSGVGVRYASLGRVSAPIRASNLPRVPYSYESSVYAYSNPSSAITTNRGGLTLYKWGHPSTRAYAWKPSDKMLYLPNKGTPKANWRQNSGKLRYEMRSGKPIYDSFSIPHTGQQIPTRGFLNAERHLLESRGWQYNNYYNAYYLPR